MKEPNLMSAQLIATKEFTADLVMHGSWGSRSAGRHPSTMELWHVKPGQSYIEWDIPALEKTEEIGILYCPETKELYDYDGIMALPIEAVAMLEENGVIVGEDFR